VHKAKGTDHVTTYNGHVQAIKNTRNPGHSLGEMKNITSVFSVLRIEQKQRLSKDPTP
jgi:hypothetical protein